MKVIDLLDMIANDEKVPKFVQYYNIIDKETEVMLVCLESIVYKLKHQEIQLNSIVSIIEENEEDNKIEKIEYSVDMDGDAYIYANHRNNFLDGVDVIIIDKINDLLDYLESKEKGE